MRRDQSYGVIPLRKRGKGWEVFLIQHNRSGYWGFPKGHAEKGEKPMDAAFRELKEETNLELVELIDEKPLTEQYTFILERKRVFKEVQYFIAIVDGSIRLQEQEIHDGNWFPFPQALSQVTHKEGKALLVKVEGFLSQ